MATSFGLASAASVVVESAHKSATNLPICHRSINNKLSFRFSPKPKLRFSYKVAVSGSSKPAFATPTKSEASSVETKDEKISDVVSPAATLASEESLSAFITQVSDLVKLVDSKDIMELHLKQLDSEIVIRKKEALAPPPSAPVTYYQPQPQYAAPPPPASSAAPTAAPSPASAPAPVPAKAPPAKSSHPPLKSPMAGTFYRSPAPGEPAFIKVGDKVQKGQVLCIIEAMKLMNEIEADRSGTIVEIVAEDAKPVSVDTPLFIIEP